VEITDLGFYRLKETKSIEIRQGKEVILPFIPVWTPAIFKVERNRLMIPADASKGPYLVIGMFAKEWQVVTVNVT